MGNMKTDPCLELIVRYYGADSLMYVDNGKSFGEGETIAKGVVVFYDRENVGEVVGVCFESGVRATLKPLIDSVLAEHGLPPVEVASRKALEQYAGPLPVDPFPEPDPVVTYDEGKGCIHVENGRPLVGEMVVAEGLTVFFDKDSPGEGAGLRIGPNAKAILKPFLDAVVMESGGDPGKSTRAPVKPAS